MSYIPSRGVRLSVCLSVWSVKIASSPRYIDGSSPNLHTMVPRSVGIQGVLGVKVKGHEIWAILL